MALINKKNQGMPVQAAGLPAVNPNDSKAALGGAMQYSDPSFGTGISTFMPHGGRGEEFRVARMGQAEGVLKSGLTTDEGDFANREALRKALGEQIAQYGGLADQREQNFMGNQERGLSRNVAQLRRQMGGTGLQGSSQGNRSMGELLAASQREMGQGLNQMQLQKGQELNQLGQGNQMNLMQSLAERGFTLQQAKSLSDLLMQQSGAEAQNILGTRTQAGPSDFEKTLGYMIQGANAVGEIIPG